MGLEVGNGSVPCLLRPLLPEEPVVAFASRMKPSPQIRSSSRTKRTAASNLVGTWQVLRVMDGPDVDE